MNKDQSTKSGRYWSDLSKLARSAGPPPVDVHHAVMAAISKSSAQPRDVRSTSLLDALNQVMASALMKPALAIVAVGACAIGYLGYRELDALFLFSSFVI